jgi:alginate O-acetyltransferase complex protein AlgI
MLLGGLWHGASWNFVFWGGLHGLYLVINHGFQIVTNRFFSTTKQVNHLLKLSGWLLTFLCVVMAWVFFRATHFSDAIQMLSSMFAPKLSYSFSSIHPILWNQGLYSETGLLLCLLFGITVFFLPNSNQIGNAILAFCKKNNALPPVFIGASLIFVALLVIVNSLRASTSAFIYFNF